MYCALGCPKFYLNKSQERFKTMNQISPTQKIQYVDVFKESVSGPTFDFISQMTASLRDFNSSHTELFTNGSLFIYKRRSFPFFVDSNYIY